MKYYPVIKVLNNATCSYMDRPKNYCQKEIQVPYDITYMQNHVTINLSAKQKQTDRPRQ